MKYYEQKYSIEIKQLKDVKKGEYIRLTNPAKTTYIRGERYPGGKHSIINFDDRNDRPLLKGSTEVYIGFTF